MKRHFLLLIIVAAAASACGNKSVSSDPSIGLTTNGNGLTTGSNYLLVNDKKRSNNNFVYGEKFSIVFNDIRGFTKQGAEVFPGMSLTVFDDKGKKLLYDADLYKDYRDPITLSPLMLLCDISVGRPMMSGKKYTARVHIWDKKGKGTFDAELKFVAMPSPAVDKTEKVAGADFKEVIFLDKTTGFSIESNEVTAGRNYQVVLEGIEGFSIVDGMCDVGASLLLRERSTGKILLEVEDFLGENGVASESDLYDGLRSPAFGFTGKRYECDVETVLWDKRSDAKVKVVTRLKVI
jgi:hypothetical protein